MLFWYYYNEKLYMWWWWGYRGYRENNGLRYDFCFMFVYKNNGNVILIVFVMSFGKIKI